MVSIRLCLLLLVKGLGPPLEFAILSIDNLPCWAFMSWPWLIFSVISCVCDFIIFYFFFLLSKGSIFQPSENRPNYAPIHYSSKENSLGRAHKGKLSKSDIGTPNNFKWVFPKEVFSNNLGEMTLLLLATDPSQHYILVPAVTKAHFSASCDKGYRWKGVSMSWSPLL